jgi:two-component sensor histidine kinase
MICAVTVGAANFVQYASNNGWALIEALLQSHVSFVLAIGVIFGVTSLPRAWLRKLQILFFLVIAFGAASDASPGNLTSVFFLFLAFVLYWAYGLSTRHLPWKAAAVVVPYIGLLTWSYSSHPVQPALATFTSLTLVVTVVFIFLRLWQAAHAWERRQSRELEQRVRERTSELQAALEERSELIKEIHHRVKNNLQLVSSFLNLSRSSSTDAAVREVLDESITRVRTIALVHERVYQSEAFTRVELDGYLQDLVAELQKLLGCTISLSSDFPTSYEVPLDFAVPFGLMVNELLTYAGERGRTEEGGCPDIAFDVTTEDAELAARISDGGHVLPTERGSQDGSPLELEIVQSLVAQLKGRVEIESAGGRTAWYIRLAKPKRAAATAALHEG